MNSKEIIWKIYLYKLKIVELYNNCGIGQTVELYNISSILKPDIIASLYWCTYEYVFSLHMENVNLYSYVDV